MWISLNWLKSFTKIDKDLSLEEWASLISLKIAEVEDIKKIGGNINKVTVVEILETHNHPNADKLKIAVINDGKAKKNVVCAAINCKAGMKTAFADLGTELILENNQKLLIKERKIRDVVSSGMLCSAGELGLSSKESSEILELPPNSPIGVKLNQLENFNDKEDILFEIDNKSLTHRPDLWGHYGFARELSTVFQSLLAPYTDFNLDSQFFSPFTIKNTIKESCYRYSCIFIKNITVQPSPEWLKHSLEKLGINSINNIVDLSNFIMLELGQPTHIFDADKLVGEEIHIRYANENEKFLTLQDEVISLNNKDIVIADNNEVIALGGVIGGKKTSVDKNTTNIILESASFASEFIRKTSQRHNIKTDSSQRFEKFPSPKNTLLAIHRYIELLEKFSYNNLSYSQFEDDNHNPYNTKTIDISYDFIYSKIGTKNIDKSFIEKTLKSLGFTIEEDEETLSLTIPFWRATRDIGIKEDIVEEIARFYGYDNIEEQSPIMALEIPKENKSRSLERKMKIFLSEGLGFNEIFTYPWTGEKQLTKYGLSSDNLLELANPISEDSQFMRFDSFPMLIDAIEKNLKYFSQFKIFEFGRIFDTKVKVDEILPTEKLVIVGALVVEQEEEIAQENSFYELKKIAEDLLLLAGVTNLQYTELKNPAPYIHPNINLEIKQKEISLAKVFKLNPTIKNKLSPKHNIFLFSINFFELINKNRKFTYTPIHRFPTVNFDITHTIKEKDWVINSEKIIYQTLKEYCKEVKVVSIYQDDNLKEKGLKNVSFRITLINKNETLSPELIQKLQKEIRDIFNIPS